MPIKINTRLPIIYTLSQNRKNVCRFFTYTAYTAAYTGITDCITTKYINWCRYVGKKHKWKTLGREKLLFIPKLRYSLNTLICKHPKHCMFSLKTPHVFTQNTTCFHSKRHVFSLRASRVFIQSIVCKHTWHLIQNRVANRTIKGEE